MIYLKVNIKWQSQGFPCMVDLAMSGINYQIGLLRTICTAATFAGLSRLQGFCKIVVSLLLSA